MIEHWVHLRCEGIRLVQNANTCTCHLHKESGLTTHIDITPPHSSKPPSHSSSRPPTPPQPKHRQTFNTPPVLTGLVKPKLNPLIPSPPHTARAKHIHISHTPTATHPTYHTHLLRVSCARHNNSPSVHTHTLTTTTHPRPPTPAFPSHWHPHTLSPSSHTTQTTVYTVTAPT